MNDDRLDAVLGSFYQDTALAPPDPEQGLSEVMRRVRQTRQRGRWLPFPLFRREAPTPTATDTADYQPTPIPATNGRAPIVIGRTQTMFSPVKAITAGALVFGLGGVLLIAQPFDQPEGGVPGAQGQPEAIDLSAVAPVTGTSLADDCGMVKRGERLDVPGVYRYRDYREECPVTSSDPRMSGVIEVIYNGDNYDGGGFVNWGTSRLEGPDGAWECVFTETGSPFPATAATAVDDLALQVCTGTDAYAGLTFVGYRGIDGEVGFGDGINLVGFIYPGDPPPPWGPPAE
jgi:hypothetical protein